MKFYWYTQKLFNLLAGIRHQQGRLLGRMEALGFRLQAEATLQMLTIDVLKSSEIEGELFTCQCFFVDNYLKGKFFIGHSL